MDESKLGERRYAPPRLGGYALILVAVTLVVISLKDTPSLDSVARQRRDVVGAVASLLAVSALTGFAAMALFQTAKHLLGLRGVFQRRALHKWLAGPNSRSWERWNWRRTPADPATEEEWKGFLQTLGDQSNTPPGPLEPWDEFVLAVRPALPPGDAWTEFLLLLGLPRDSGRLGGLFRPPSFFDLPAEQLLSQVSEVADEALERLAERTLGSESSKPFDKDSRAGFAFLFVLARASGRKAITEYLSAGQSKVDAERSKVDEDREKARSNAAAALQREMDALLISLGDRWRWQVRLWASLLSGLLTVVVVVTLGMSYPNMVAFVTAGFLFGGFFSWLFRDLVALIERRR